MSIAILVVTCLTLAFVIAPLYSIRPAPPWLDEVAAFAVLVLLGAMVAMVVEASGMGAYR